MNTISTAVTPKPIVYPDSDGQPMAENTLQFRWIVTLQGGLDAQFRDAANVFVAGDLLWYPVEGSPNIRQAPDILIAFDRPKGYRGSYKQWEEGGIPPQVVIEIQSPGNRTNELIRKFQFYEKYGVEEYYLFDPEHEELFGWLRDGDQLKEVPSMEGWASPRLKIRFSFDAGELVVTGADGRRFATYVELAEQREQALQTAEQLRAQLKAMGIEPKA